MNAHSTALATEHDNLPAARAARNNLTTLSSDGGGIVFKTVSEARDVAYLMAGSDKAVRKHLRNNPGACFGIVIQAVEWGMSPYAVANKSYEVNDQLAYESQLIQAVILRRAPLKGRIKYHFEGEGNDRVCIASAVTLDGETVEYRSPAFGKITPKNSPLWKNDPDQQQSYYSGRALCRRHFPDVLMGIYDVDEIDGTARDVTPPSGSGLASRLQNTGGGFDASSVQGALGEAQEAQLQPDGEDVAAGEESGAGEQLSEQEMAADRCVDAMAEAETLDALKAAFADGWKVISDIDQRARIKGKYEALKASLTQPSEGAFPGDLPSEGED